MRIKLLILTFFSLLFGAKSVFAVTITLSNIPPTISDQAFNINVSISGASSGTNYLRIDLYKNGTTNYFGDTYNGTNWYNGSTGTQYFPISITSGQTANISLQGRLGSPSSNDYPGSGSYKIKVRRYTSSGNTSASDTQTPQDITINYTFPTSTPTSSPTSAPTSQSSSSFIISNIPTEINSDQPLNTGINLSLSDYPNTQFYLKGAFRKPDSSNYFGLTKVGNSWVKNSSSYSNQYQITTDSSGNWSGNLSVQPDPLDSGYNGSGDYNFKVGRYTSSGSGPVWSNEVSLKINSQDVVISDQDSGDAIINLASVSESSVPEILGKATIAPKSSDEEYNLDQYIKSSTPSATTSAQSKTEIKNTHQINYLSIIGIFLVIIGGIYPGYAIYNFFKSRNN